MRLTLSLIFLAAAFALTLLVARHRDQPRQADNFNILYDMDGPRRIPKPTSEKPPSASEVAVDKTCSDQLGAVHGWLNIAQEGACRAASACRASVFTDTLRFDCAKCALQISFELADRTTYIDRPRFLDGMLVDVGTMQDPSGRWVTVRDSAGDLLLAASLGAAAPPVPDFYRSLAIESAPSGRVVSHAGKTTRVPTRADCISADHGLYYFGTADMFLAYSTRQWQPR